MTPSLRGLQAIDEIAEVLQDVRKKLRAAPLPDRAARLETVSVLEYLFSKLSLGDLSALRHEIEETMKLVKRKAA